MTASLLIGVLYLACFASEIRFLLYDRGYSAGMAEQQRITEAQAAARLAKLMAGIRRQPVQPSPIWLTLVASDSPADAAEDLCWYLTGMPALDEREPWEGE